MVFSGLSTGSFFKKHHWDSNACSSDSVSLGHVYERPIISVPMRAVGIHRVEKRRGIDTYLLFVIIAILLDKVWCTAFLLDVVLISN